MSRKLESSSAREISKEIYQLYTRIRVLDKGIESYLSNGRNVSAEYLSELLKEHKKNYKCRLSDVERLKRRILLIREKSKKFKILVANVEPTDEYVKTVKELMEDIESLITETKQEQKESYEGLLKTEIRLWEECVTCESRIAAWESGEEPASRSGAVPVVIATSVNTSPDNQAFLAVQKFLDETGGSCGGWAAVDHGTFMRIRQKYAGRGRGRGMGDETAFCEDLAGLLAPKTVSDIEAHEIWFQHYEELLLAKKKAIEEWKKSKNNEKTKTDTLQSVDEPRKEGDGKMDWASRKQILEDKRKAVDAWRTDKAMEEYKLKMEKENQQKLELERRKKQQEEKQKEVREQVELYKQQRLEEEAIRMEKELRRKVQIELEQRRVTEIHSARINERNTRMVEEHIFKCHRKDEENRRRQERLSRVTSAVKVTRDPSRLLQPTEGWINRLHCEDNAGASSSSAGAIRIATVQHKAVPAWRQNPG